MTVALVTHLIHHFTGERDAIAPVLGDEHEFHSHVAQAPRDPEGYADIKEFSEYCGALPC